MRENYIVLHLHTKEIKGVLPAICSYHKYNKIMDYLGSVCHPYRKKYLLSQAFYDSTSFRWSPWFRRLSRGLGTFFPSMWTTRSGAVQKYCGLPNIQDEKDIEAEYEQSRCDGKERRQKKAPMELFISYLGQPAVKNFKPPWNERWCHTLAIYKTFPDVTLLFQ